MKEAKDHILIVDDKVKNIYALEQILNQPGRNLISVTNGNDALKVALNQEIDLIILDVQMPGMDGFEVAQILKSNKRTSETPIIFVTAELKDHKFVMKGFEEGAIDYLYKPINPEIIEAKVSVLLQLHRQQRELMEKNLALEKYALLINNSADLICIINGSTLRFEEVNDAVDSLLGYTVKEFKGSSLLFYLSEEDRTKIQQLSKEHKSAFSFETLIYTKSRVPRYFSWNVVHKHGLWFANGRDITEMKEVEEIRNYLAVVVKQSNDAIYLHNPDGKIISWNEGAEKMYGFLEKEALNMYLWNIVPKQLMTETQQVINNILHGAKVEALETRRITKYGKIIDVIFAASVITDPNGNLKSVAITERDITRQKKADFEINQLNTNLERNIAQLQLTNKELESFSYSVSHDLRAPLRSINGYAQMIQDDHAHEFNDETKRMLNVIRNNAKKMGVLIDDLLAFSRMGRKEIAQLLIDFNKLVEPIVAEMKNNAPASTRITVHPLHNTQGDPALLAQVYINLISNAIKYSSKKETPDIEIGSEEKEDEYVYYVKDHGAGFDMKYAHKLFGVFQRLHSNEEFEGTGVGLAIVQRIVVKHGGKVWAEGKVDEGATFYFSLPKINNLII